MAYLLRFEDTYGMCDISLGCNGKQYAQTIPGTIQRYGEFDVICGLSISKALYPGKRDIAQEVSEQYTDIITVFDMDNDVKDKSTIRSVEQLSKAIELTSGLYRKLGYSGRLHYVPVIYSAETASLYQFLADDSLSFDLETLVSKWNTPEMLLMVLAWLNKSGMYTRAKRARDYFNAEKFMQKVRGVLSNQSTCLNATVLGWILDGLKVPTWNLFDVLVIVTDANVKFSAYLNKSVTFNGRGLGLDSNMSKSDMEQAFREYKKNHQ